MASNKQPDQKKENSTRPKEPRNRRGSAYSAVQSDDAAISTLQKDSQNLGRHTSSAGDHSYGGHSIDRKTSQKKSSRVQKSKTNPTDDKNETDHLSIQKNRRQSVKDTPAKREIANGKSSGTSDKIAQLPDNGKNSVNEFPSATPTKKVPATKLKTSGSLDTETNRTKDQKVVDKTDNQKKLSLAKCKSSDDIRENGQPQAKVALEKKVSGKTSKEDKVTVSKLDNGDVAESKGRGVKTADSKTSKEGKVTVSKVDNGDVAESKGRDVKTDDSKTSKECKVTVSKVDNGDVAESKGRDVKTDDSKIKTLKDVLERKLRLKMDDISNAAAKVNGVVDRILNSVQLGNDPLFKDIERMSSGSYYERVKISDPNEFDIMLKITPKTYNTIVLTNLDKELPFYTLAYKQRISPEMKKYLDDNNNISARQIMDEFRSLINQLIGKPGMEIVSLQDKDKKNPGSPAVTIIIKNEPQDISVDLVLALKILSKWPEETTHGMNIDKWLGTKVKQELKTKENFYMVPKQAMVGGKLFLEDTWRISFSNIEKNILTKHGHVKTCCEKKQNMCCRKPCLKLLKYLLELLKANGNKTKMDQFFSYHAKTALLHHCAAHPTDEEWKYEDLDKCFNRYVDYFQECLKSHILPNFFLPLNNLFNKEFVKEPNCDYLYKKIEEQKRNGYPIFYE